MIAHNKVMTNWTTCAIAKYHEASGKRAKEVASDFMDKATDLLAKSQPWLKAKPPQKKFKGVPDKN